MDTVFLEKICRCCLNECDDMTNLFDSIESLDQFTFDPPFTYADLVYLCTNIRFDLDVVDANDHIVEFPRNVCEACLLELRTAFTFRQKCESSDNLLREQTIRLSHTDEMVEYDNVNKNSNESIEISALRKKDNWTVQESAVDEYANATEIKVETVRNREDVENQIRLQPLDKYSPNDVNQEEKFNCAKCSDSFDTEQDLINHTNWHSVESSKRKSSIATASDREKVNGHQCTDCDKIFSSQSRLRCHLRTHTGEKPYRCDQCDLTFAQGNALRCHKRIHTGEKPYECRFCHKRFTQNTILKTHMTLHTGKTIKCPDCDKLFSRASNLILHRREHTGEKPYACSQCPNRYKQKSHLDRHMDTHLGVKHKCSVCQKVYSKRWSLKVHMFTHSNEKPHRCTICDAEFIRRDKYNNHMKTIHGVPAATDESNLSVKMSIR